MLEYTRFAGSKCWPRLHALPPAKSYSKLTVHVRVMTSHDASTSGTSLVFTVASLQRLKLEALIVAPADYEVRS